MSGETQGADDSIIKPDVSSDFASDIARRYFNVCPVVVKELHSYDDRNFYMETESGDLYLLKVSNSLETESKAYGKHKPAVISSSKKVLESKIWLISNKRSNNRLAKTIKSE